MNSSGRIALGNGCFGMNAFGKRPNQDVTYDNLDADQIRVKRLKIGYPTEADSYDMPESKGNIGDVLTTGLTGDAEWIPPSLVGATYESVIYRPGAVSSLNIAGTWAEVITFVNNGVLTIFVDDSITSPAVINVNADLLGKVSIKPYNFDAASVPTLEFANDVQLTNVQSIDGPINVVFHSITLPNLVFSPGQIFPVTNGAYLLQSALSLVPACQVDGILIFTLTQGAHADTLGQSIFNVSGTDTMILVQLLNTGQPSGDFLISGSAGSTLFNLRDASGQDLVLTSFLGTRQTQLVDQAVGVSYDDSLTPPTTGITNVQSLLDYLKLGNFTSLILNEAGVPKWEMKSTAGGEMWTSALPSDTRILRLLPAYPGPADPALFQLGETAGCNVACYGYFDCLTRSFLSRVDDTTSIEYRFRNAAVPASGWSFIQNAGSDELQINSLAEAPAPPKILLAPLGDVSIQDLRVGVSATSYKLPTARGVAGDVLTATGGGDFTAWSPLAAGPPRRYLSAYIAVPNGGITAFPGPGITIEAFNTGGVLVQNGTNDIAEWTLGLQSVGYVGVPTINAHVTVTFDAITAGTANLPRVWSLSKNFVLDDSSFVQTQVGIRASYALQAIMTLNTGDAITPRVSNVDGNLTGVIISQMSINVVEF